MNIQAKIAATIKKELKLKKVTWVNPSEVFYPEVYRVVDLCNGINTQCQFIHIITKRFHGYAFDLNCVFPVENISYNEKGMPGISYQTIEFLIYKLINCFRARLEKPSNILTDPKNIEVYLIDDLFTFANLVSLKGFIVTEDN